MRRSAIKLCSSIRRAIEGIWKIGAGSFEHLYEKVVWTKSVRDWKTVSEHFVLFWGKFVRITVRKVGTGKMHDKLAWLIKHVPFIQWLYQKVMSLVFRVMGLLISVDEKLVLLSSYGGDQYSDSPKVLFEAMRLDPRFAGFHYVWAFGDPTKFDISRVDKVKIDTLSYFKTALRAKKKEKRSIILMHEIS